MRQIKLVGGREFLTSNEKIGVLASVLYYHWLVDHRFPNYELKEIYKEIYH